MSWHGALALHYRRDGERTIAHDRHEGPLRVLQRLYPEGPHICHHVLVHPPGGIVGGDVLEIEATLEPELEDVLRVLGAKRWDVLIKVGLPRSMPYFYGSLKVAITLAFVGTVLAEMTAGDSGIGYLISSASSQQRVPLAFAGLVTIGVMAMAMYELFSWVERRTTGWAHRGSQAA